MSAASHLRFYDIRSDYFYLIPYQLADHAAYSFEAWADSTGLPRDKLRGDAGDQKLKEVAKQAHAAALAYIDANLESRAPPLKKESTGG